MSGPIAHAHQREAANEICLEAGLLDQERGKRIVAARQHEGPLGGDQ